MKSLIFIAQIAAILAVTASAEPLRITITLDDPDPEQTPVVLDEAELYCMNEAVYWEARNQDGNAMAAVAHVIKNRVRSPDFPDTVCGVVHQGPLDGSNMELNKCQFSYYCDGKSDQPPTEDFLEVRAWNFARIISEIIMIGGQVDITNGSTHYHAYYADPFWNDEYEMVAEHGDHLFYVHY